jgi:hypothetical protein
MEDEIKRSILDKNISVENFENFYWYKKELQNFCKNLKISTNGKKLELKERIIYFLKTGNLLEKKSQKKTKRVDVKEISLNSVIEKNFRMTNQIRNFFKSYIGDHFHFTVHNMLYIKKNLGKITYEDYINEWKLEFEKRKNKNYKPKISKSCEYNQYIRDFFSENKSLKLKDAIKCWNFKKSMFGNNKYNKKDLVCLK